MIINIIYIFIAIAIVMRIFELKDEFIDIWSEDESIKYKVLTSGFAIVMKSIIIIFTIYFSNYFINFIECI